MPTKYKSSLKKMIGHVSFRSVMSNNDKGRYFASTTIDGNKYTGEGLSEREATIDLRQQVDQLAIKNAVDIPT